MSFVQNVPADLASNVHVRLIHNVPSGMRVRVLFDENVPAHLVLYVEEATPHPAGHHTEE